MPRPKQSRQVMTAPEAAGFKPFGRSCMRRQPVILGLDEYETIRLLDYVGMQQAEAATAMNVSRPTLTRIYNSARQNMAKALVEGRPISISGGNADFADYQEQKNNIKVMNQKIAIPTADGKLCQHFGQAPQVTVVTIENNAVTETLTLTAPPHEHGSLPRFIASHNCTDVLCGGLGSGAVNMLNQLGIQVHGGAPAIGIDELLEQYLNGSIVYGDSNCHHDHHGGEGHQHQHRHHE